MENNSQHAQHVLKKAKNILLVDWPNAGVPRALLEAGFKVYSYSPGEYSEAALAGGSNEVSFAKIDGSPAEVDIVNIFRPEQEHLDIIEKQVLPLKAKVVWLHPPVMSASTADLAKEHSLTFIEGVDIAEMAAELKKERS